MTDETHAERERKIAFLEGMAVTYDEYAERAAAVGGRRQARVQAAKARRYREEAEQLRGGAR